MAQRLGIAAALLGDPAVLLLDEPVNGLDPEGIRWTGSLLKNLAAHGRTVLVSSHLIEEVAQTADQLIVIGQAHCADHRAELLLQQLPRRGSFQPPRAAPSTPRRASLITGACLDHRYANPQRNQDRRRLRIPFRGPDGVAQLSASGSTAWVLSSRPA